MTFLRLGLYGGSFDPPHLGHLILARAACSQLQLERVLWIPAGTQPLKLDQTPTSVEHRLAMLALLLGDDERFALSRVEVDRPGPHYSVDTVHILAEQNPGAALVFLMGGDSLRDLPRWRSPGELVSACSELGVMLRPDISVDLEMLESQIPGLTARVRFIDAPLVEISASEIRRRIAAGRGVRQFLHPKVYQYIRQHGLYR